MTQLTAQLEDVVSSANEVSDLMENEQMEHCKNEWVNYVNLMWVILVALLL